MLGYLSSHFFFYFMKPRLFDPVFKEGGKPLPQSEYWRSFIIAACLSVIGVLQVLAAYIYVETYYTIPEAWTASIREICKDARKTELFQRVTAFMQFLSVVGDGDLYVFLVIGCCWCRGRIYDYNYLLLCIVLVCHWPNLLKQVLRDARP